MLQTSIAFEKCNVLKKLKLLSDDADVKIYEHNNEDVQLQNWISTIKAMADSIIAEHPDKNSIETKISNPVTECDEVPNLLQIIKGGHSNNKRNRISTLLADMQKDHVKHIARKSRQSSRKIVLRKSKYQWRVSNRNSTAKNKDSKASNSNEMQLMNLQQKLSQTKNKSFNLSIKEVNEDYTHNKSLNNQVIDSGSKTNFDKSIGIISDSVDQCTPIQNNEILVPNTCGTPSVNKINLNPNLTRVVKLKKLPLVSANAVHCENFTPESGKKDISVTSDKFVTPENKDDFYTPDAQTIVKDKANFDEPQNKRPNTRVKRKSSFQLTQDNIKSKHVKTSSQEIGIGRSCKVVEENSKNRSIRKGKAAQVSAVIQAKTSGIINHQIVDNEKRILKEIQKKEEMVEQNAKKLKSLRQRKIEENKKTREMKMEKAMQQRLKIEKEKEERLRCRTVSKQENMQLNKSASKKTTAKKLQILEDRISSAKKVVSTPKKNKTISTSPSKNLKHQQVESMKKVPTKPVRTPAKKVKITPDSKEDLKSKMDQTYFLQLADKPTIAEKETFTKPLNTTYNAIKSNLTLTSTPTAKKIDPKTSASKTPLNAAAQKLRSYAMTPSESSFVSYDVSEIKSDDDDDDEEEKVNHKPIPSWATGVCLKTALLNQNYNKGKIDLDELFGNYFETPDLEAIMGVQKKHYFKRTSSAIWLDSPNRSIFS